MTPVEALIQIRELLSNPNSWIKKLYAQDSKGEPCRSTSNEAVCWCLLGGAKRVCRDDPSLLQNVLWIIGDCVPQSTYPCRNSSLDCGIEVYNDRPDVRHLDILNVLDRAIEKATIEESS